MAGPLLIGEVIDNLWYLLLVHRRNAGDHWVAARGLVEEGGPSGVPSKVQGKTRNLLKALRYHTADQAWVAAFGLTPDKHGKGRVIPLNFPRLYNVHVVQIPRKRGQPRLKRQDLQTIFGRIKILDGEQVFPSFLREVTP